MSPFQKEMNGGSKLTSGYPPILSGNSDAYREGGVGAEAFEGRKGNIPFYFHTQSDAAAESDPAGRGPGCGDVVY